MKWIIKKKEVPVINKRKEKAIIVDIDGTLANIDHRRHLVEGEKKDWKQFNYEAVNDTPNKAVVELCSKFSYSYPIKILFVSGRNESLRTLTKMQIKDWLNIYDYELFMRKNDDFRRDTELKLEIFSQVIKDKYDILFAVDDNKDIVDLWRFLGIFTFDCACYERKDN